VINSTESSLFDIPTHSCRLSTQSAVSARGTTSDEHRSQHVSGDQCDLLSRNDGSPSAVHLSTCRTTCDGVPPDAESRADTAGSSRQRSRSRNLVSTLVSQLHMQLAPLSDFLTQHLAVLQTWLSCASYGQLVVILCQHIAEVICIDSRSQLAQYRLLSLRNVTITDIYILL